MSMNWISMNNFNEIKNKFINIQNDFNENVRDNVGSTIDYNSLQPIGQSINQLLQIDQKIAIQMVQIDKLLFEAKSILPKV